MKKLQQALFTMLLLVAVIDTRAQNTPQGDFEGLDFWCAFLPNSSGSTTNLYVSSRFATTATVSTPLIPGGLNQVVTIPANTIVTVPIAATYGGVNMSTAVANINMASTNGIHITCPDPIAVFGSNVSTASSEGWLNIPADKLGNDYYSCGFTAGSTTSPSEVMVLATEPGTTVVNFVVPTGKVVQGQANSNFSITLGQGQTYLIHSGSAATGDAAELAGIRITSTKKFAVYSGAMSTGYPAAGNRGGYTPQGPLDHMVENLIPISAWGGTYLLTPFDEGTTSTNMDTKGNYMRVMAADPGTTTVNITGQAPIVLNGAGSYMDRLFTTHTRVTSNKKIIVYQIMGAACGYATTCTALGGTGIGDACFTNISPSEQWGKEYRFTTPTGATAYTHYMNVIKQGALGVVLLDGTAQTGFVNIAGTNYYAKNFISVSAGAHTVTGDSVFTVYSYGIELAGSYCNQVSGATLKPVVVPVKFLEFIAKRESSNVKLRWVTSEEKNVKEYTIMRASKGQFEPIYTIEAGVNSTASRSYQFIDNNPAQGINVYQIKQIDYNGNPHYSSLANVQVPILHTEILNSSWTDSELKVSLLADDAMDLELNLYSMNGARLRTALIKVNNAGEHEAYLHVPGLTGGFYVLRVESGGVLLAQSKLAKL